MTNRLMPNIRLRPATLEDVPTLDRWDEEPHVQAATSDDPGAEDEYDDDYWRGELALTAPDYQYFIGELREGDHWRPLGAMQIIDPHTESTHYWGEIEPNLRALDIWIGAASDLGQGYGEQMMRLALAHCFASPEVTAVIIDPLTSNLRSHTFYQRLGFVPTHRQLFHDEDDCLVHRLTRGDWRARFPEDAPQHVQDGD